MAPAGRRDRSAWINTVAIVLVLAAAATIAVLRWNADKPSAQEMQDARFVAEQRAQVEQEQRAKGLVPWVPPK